MPGVRNLAELCARDHLGNAPGIPGRPRVSFAVYNEGWCRALLACNGDILRAPGLRLLPKLPVGREVDLCGSIGGIVAGPREACFRVGVVSATAQCQGFDLLRPLAVSL